MVRALSVRAIARRGVSRDETERAPRAPSEGLGARGRARVTLDVKVTLARVSGSKHFLEVAVPDDSRSSRSSPRGAEPVPARGTEAAEKPEAESRSNRPVTE